MKRYAATLAGTIGSARRRLPASAAGMFALLDATAHRFGSRAALCIREGGSWKSMSYASLSRRARRLAERLVSIGLRPGDRVVILSEPRPEWGVGFFAGIRSGAVLVPIDPTLREAELIPLLLDCAPRLALASHRYQALAVRLMARVPSIQRVVPLEEDRMERGEVQGVGARSGANGAVRDRTLEDVVLIVYSSGTLGHPKGVMLTGRNVLFQVESSARLLTLSPRDRFLSILPPHHTLELTGGFLGALHAGARVDYASTLYPEEVMRCVRERGTTLLIGVPLFFKTLHRHVARAPSVGSGMGARPFGRTLRAFISGGAPMEAALVRDVARLGVPILQGYGLTETSPVISVNTPSANRAGSVGRPLPGVEVRIATRRTNAVAGEILTRGPHVMKGYYRREDLTRTVIDARRWFHTGDLGYLDGEGFLHVTGRLKNLIVLGGGKKVQPEEVEAVLSRSPLIQEVCVVGRRSTEGITDGTEEVCAVVVPLAVQAGGGHGPAGSARERIREDLARVAQALPPYQRPVRLFVHDGPFPKTASRKIKRSDVLAWLDTRGARG